MKAELQKKLIEKYPEFFEYLKEHKGPIMPIQFGFECHDGWYVLIDTLMGCIQSHIKWNCPDKPVQVTQIKEKFGGLRFYFNGGDEQIDGMVHLAESMSYRTCEFCGTTQNIGRTTGWIFTVCKECFDTGKVTQHEWKSLETLEKEHEKREKEIEAARAAENQKGNSISDQQ